MPDLLAMATQTFIVVFVCSLAIEALSVLRDS